MTNKPPVQTAAENLAVEISALPRPWEAISPWLVYVLEAFDGALAEHHYDEALHDLRRAIDGRLETGRW